MAATTFVNVVQALAPLELEPVICASVIGALAPVLLETPRATTEPTNERKKPGPKKCTKKRLKRTGKGEQWRVDAARKGAETKHRQKEGAGAAGIGEAIKSRPRSKDARLRPVIAQALTQ